MLNDYIPLSSFSFNLILNNLSLLPHFIQLHVGSIIILVKIACISQDQSCEFIIDLFQQFCIIIVFGL